MTYWFAQWTTPPPPGPYLDPPKSNRISETEWRTREEVTRGGVSRNRLGVTSAQVSSLAGGTRRSDWPRARVVNRTSEKCGISHSILVAEAPFSYFSISISNVNPFEHQFSECLEKKVKMIPPSPLNISVLLDSPHFKTKTVFFPPYGYFATALS